MPHGWILTGSGLLLFVAALLYRSGRAGRRRARADREELRARYRGAE